MFFELKNFKRGITTFLIVCLILAHIQTIDGLKLDSWQPEKLWSELNNFDRMLYVYNLYLGEFMNKTPNIKLQEEALKVIEIMMNEVKSERRLGERDPYLWYIRKG